MSDAYAISLENIYKSFGSVEVLKDVNFHLEKGTVHALVGGNGAGKSTLMKILTGVYTCDSGKIVVDGKEVKIRNTKDAQKNGIKMIFQELSLSPTMTVMENIFLANESVKGIALNKKEMYQRTAELFEELHIHVKPTDKVKDLDVGVQQLVEIAKALSVEAKVLIMDEPTASLTEKETNTLFRIIEQLKEKGVSIVYISHRMKEIFRVCDKITVLKDGEIVQERNKVDFTLDSLIEVMLGGNVEKQMKYIPREEPIGDEKILTVRNLTVGDRVDGVSFELRKGEILGLAGLMGSGRTETLEALFGLRKKGEETEILMNGQPVKLGTVSQAIQNGFALIPEDRRRQGLVLEHTLKENVVLPNFRSVMKGIRIDRDKVRAMTEDAIDTLSIKTGSVDAGMLSLSGGNQQKAVIAKWLNTNPKILMMDEPTAGVDVMAKAEIIDIVRKFVTKGNSVIFVSSELSEMMAICDRILVYHSGKIKQEFEREKIESEEQLEYAIQH